MFGLYKENKRLFEQNLDLKIINHCIRLFSLDSNIFPSLSCENVSILERTHKLVLITIIAKKYLKIRLHSFSKTYTESINVIYNYYITITIIIYLIIHINEGIIELIVEINYSCGYT